MDPDVALEDIRSIVRDVNAGEPGDLELALDTLAQLVSGLDEWLTRGGFLPAAWQR